MLVEPAAGASSRPRIFDRTRPVKPSVATGQALEAGLDAEGDNCLLSKERSRAFQ